MSNCIDFDKGLKTYHSKIGFIHSHFNARITNTLMASGVITVRDLGKKTQYQLLEIPNFSDKSLLEVRDWLDENKLYLSMKDEDIDSLK